MFDHIRKITAFTLAILHHSIEILGYLLYVSLPVKLKLKCNQGQVKMLHAKEKHYVKISVHRANENLARYNFRINVSLAGENTQNTERYIE